MIYILKTNFIVNVLANIIGKTFKYGRKRIQFYNKVNFIS